MTSDSKQQRGPKADELHQSILRERDPLKRRALAQELKTLAESGSVEALVPLATLLFFGLNAMPIHLLQVHGTGRVHFVLFS